MDLMLKGKTALITAASRGLGYATARALAQEGVNIALCARNETALEEAAHHLRRETGVTVLPVVADIAQAADIQRLVEQTVAQFQRIDMLFINAGGPMPGHFLSLTMEHWDAAIQLTLQSAIRLAYAVVPLMRRQGEGSILANTSITVRQPLDGLTISNALRTAVVGLVKTLSIELGADNIRVNAIAPGWTRTERLNEILRARSEQNSTTLEEEAAKIAVDVPLRRMADPVEFARVAAFLLSPAASYITGVTLLVDGGMARAVM
ncbi:MAG TPA: SDR family oxidoreductase [Anaerolineae bacterium]|nr:SDR family oxidoreductase [Anaerolineae bacterium]HQH39059.1 SDR family oxidoreductase [Anaerolineae bacterium]